MNQGSIARALRWALALGASLILVACQATGYSPDDSRLLGAWQLDTVGGQPTVEHTHASMTFTHSGLSGNASCNRFFGSYDYRENSLKISDLASTKMMCRPSVMAQENEVLARLVQASRVEVYDDALRLLNDQGEVLITARRVEGDE